jgi:hypothetical protein
VSNPIIPYRGSIDSSNALSYDQARTLLRKKWGATDEEIALWVHHDDLNIYSPYLWKGRHWQELSIWLPHQDGWFVKMIGEVWARLPVATVEAGKWLLTVEPEKWQPEPGSVNPFAPQPQEDPHASVAQLLGQFYFSRQQVDDFDPAMAGRYLSYQQTLERLSSYSDPEHAKVMLEREIRNGRLMPFHYVTGVVPWEPEQQASGHFPSLEQAMFLESAIESLVKNEFGDAATTPKEAARGAGPAEVVSPAAKPTAEEFAKGRMEEAWRRELEENMSPRDITSKSQMVDWVVAQLEQEHYGLYHPNTVRPWAIEVHKTLGVPDNPGGRPRHR